MAFPLQCPQDRADTRPVSPLPVMAATPSHLESPGHPAGPGKDGLTTAMTTFLVVRAKRGTGHLPLSYFSIASTL